MIVRRAITIESEIKQRNDTKNYAKITNLQEAIEKSPILLLGFWRNQLLDRNNDYFAF